MDDLLAALRAAAEPTRLRLLALCAHAELSVSELTQIMGQSQPRVSRHLKLLCEAGLIDRFREGTNAFYRLAGSGRAAEFARSLVDTIPTDDQTLSLDLERLEAIRRERANAAAEYFRKNAHEWHAIRSLYVAEKDVEQALLQLLPEEGLHDVLDIGTGTGRILELLAARAERAVGIDQSRDMLSVARANLERAGLRNCAARLGDMYALPWPAASFDAVTVHQVLHFAEEPSYVIAEAARVLRPGGRLVVVDFAPHDREELREVHKHRRLGFHDNEVQRWFRDSGLTAGPAVRLPGDPLTVCLWPGTRNAAPKRAGGAATHAGEGRA